MRSSCWGRSSCRRREAVPVGARAGAAKVGAVAVVPFPHRRGLRLPDLPRPAELVPTGRAVLVVAATLGAAGLLYLVARATPVFAVRSIEVTGVHGAAAAHVRAALRSLEGKSLLALHAADVEDRLAAVPEVRRATYDRAFPSTLRITVVPEQPVAVVRQGAAAWLLSARGRVLSRLDRRTARALPRIWLPRAAEVVVGATLAPDDGGRAAAALAVARRVGFRAGVRDVSVVEGSLVFALRSGLDLRLGDQEHLALKLAVAARILPLASNAEYVDVSLPARPVAGAASSTPAVANTQLSD
jgi:cell division protein FtsQ